MRAWNISYERSTDLDNLQHVLILTEIYGIQQLDTVLLQRQTILVKSTLLKQEREQRLKNKRKQSTQHFATKQMRIKQ